MQLTALLLSVPSVTFCIPGQYFVISRGLVAGWQWRVTARRNTVKNSNNDNDSNNTSNNNNNNNLEFREIGHY
jgi:hypothetical protein